MASIRKTAVIFLFFFSGFGVAELFGYDNTLRNTDLDFCNSCVFACLRIVRDETSFKCDPEDRPCICGSIRKGIQCMQACPESAQDPECPYTPIRQYKKYYSEVLHCPASDRKSA